MDCSQPGSSVHGIFQERILEWVAMPSSGNLPDPEVKLGSLISPALAGGSFTIEQLRSGASQVAMVVKNPPANATNRRVQSQGREDPLEEGMATHSSILAWRIPRTEEPGWLHTAHGVTNS